MKDHSRLTFLFENVPYLISRMWCDFFFTMFLIIQSVENKCCADFQMYFSGLEGFSRRRREFFRKYFQYISPMQVVANIQEKLHCSDRILMIICFLAVCPALSTHEWASPFPLFSLNTTSQNSWWAEQDISTLQPLNILPRLGQRRNIYKTSKVSRGG